MDHRVQHKEFCVQWRNWEGGAWNESCIQAKERYGEFTTWGVNKMEARVYARFKLRFKSPVSSKVTVCKPDGRGQNIDCTYH